MSTALKLSARTRGRTWRRVPVSRRTWHRLFSCGPCAAPHSGQNLLAGGIGLPQFTQGTVAACRLRLRLSPPRSCSGRTSAPSPRLRQGRRPYRPSRRPGCWRLRAWLPPPGTGCICSDRRRSPMDVRLSMRLFHVFRQADVLNHETGQRQAERFHLRIQAPFARTR